MLEVNIDFHLIKYFCENGNDSCSVVLIHLYYTIFNRSSLFFHELGQEFPRGIGGLLYGTVPADTRTKVDRVINNINLSVDATIEEAEFQIKKRILIRL